MTDTTLTQPRPARIDIDTLIDTHGLRPVLAALVGAIISRRPRRAIPNGLSAHLKRDIGLPQDPGPPPARLPERIGPMI